MRAVVRGLSAAVAGIALLLAVPAVADARGGAGGGDETGSGYEVGVRVTFTGDGAPGGGGTYTVSLPPVCWWEPIPGNIWLGDPPVDATDPQSVLEWYDIAFGQTSGTFAPARGVFPPREVFLDAIAREAAGEDLTWYRISVPTGGNAKPCAPYMNDAPGSWGGEIAVSYYPWAAGDPPAPAVDPETLAIEAREVMEIAEPEVDRNPKIVDGPVDATFVNVPTWFWVVDPEMVGGAAGTRTVRADVEGSDVWAEVTATTAGLSLASPNGARQCEPERALRTWAPGAADAEGCTVEFSRASVAYPGGYPVTAATEWTAVWASEEEDGTAVGGDLDPLQRESTVNVPVAEVQTVVTSGR